MGKLSKAQREANRKAADVRGWRTKDNNHFMHTTKGGYRLDWWPSTGRWRVNQVEQDGDLDKFLDNHNVRAELNGQNNTPREYKPQYNWTETDVAAMAMEYTDAEAFYHNNKTEANYEFLSMIRRKLRERARFVLNQNGMQHVPLNSGVKLQ